jgi:type I site-specific restriction endonuclease
MDSKYRLIMDVSMEQHITPEDQARLIIDKKLVEAGWTIQDKKRMNLYAGKDSIHGIAIREMDTSTGPVDYMLFIDGKPSNSKQVLSLIAPNLNGWR